MMTSIKFLYYLGGNFKPYAEIPLMLMCITCSPIKAKGDTYALRFHVGGQTHQNDGLRKGTKVQKDHVRPSDICFSLLDI